MNFVCFATGGLLLEFIMISHLCNLEEFKTSTSRLNFNFIDHVYEINKKKTQETQETKQIVESDSSGTGGFLGACVGGVIALLLGVFGNASRGDLLLTVGAGAIGGGAIGAAVGSECKSHKPVRKKRKIQKETIEMKNDTFMAINSLAREISQIAYNLNKKEDMIKFGFFAKKDAYI